MTSSSDYRHSPRTPMGLSVCPFSLGVFLGTAALVTYRQRQLRLQQSERGSDDASKQAADAADLPVCQVVFVLGGPGSGKGTQCELLTTRNKDWAHLSAGDLLRAERNLAGGSPMGDLINQRIAAGQLVPSEVTCQLLENGMKKYQREHGITKFLIDGFPRSQGNMDAWMNTMTKHTVEFVLYLTCPEEVLVGRLLERGQTSGRTDDTMEVIRKRFQTDKESTYPIVQMFEQEGKVRKIASDKPVEDVYSDVASLFQNL